MNAVRVPFSRATNFTNGLKRKFEETIFKNLHFFSLQSVICVTIGFPLIFGKTNFMEVQKSMKSAKFVVLEKRRPTVSVLLKEIEC